MVYTKRDGPHASDRMPNAELVPLPPPPSGGSACARCCAALAGALRHRPSHPHAARMWSRPHALRFTCAWALPDRPRRCALLLDDVQVTLTLHDSRLPGGAPLSHPH